MVYRWLADVVMVLHAGLIVFFLVGGYLAWRWRAAIWAHLGIVVWNLAIVLIDFPCPITGLEKALRRAGGESVYQGGFIHHYIDGHVYPAGYTWLAEKISFALVIIAYLGLAVRWWRSRRRAG